jgi:hypothetical protein
MPSGDHAPAIVVAADDTCVNLQVFVDDEAKLLWRIAVMQSEVIAGTESPRPFTWHWPEREDEKPTAQSVTDAGGIDARAEPLIGDYAKVG